MTCLFKKFYKKELEDYTSILGSEAAAYYVLAMNNGNTLDKTPNGEPSQLYEDLLNALGGNVERAILEKALYYTQDYIKKNGDWTKEGKEPAMDLSLVVTDNSISQEILLNDSFNEINDSLVRNGVDDKEYAMRTAIERTRQAYLDHEDSKFISNYRQKQVDRFNSNKFFTKVLAFVRSPFNFRKIKDPSSKERKTARDSAFKEFNDTLQWLILTLLIDKTSTHISKFLSDVYRNNSTDEIHSLLSVLDFSSKGLPLILTNKELVYNILSLLDSMNYLVYEDGIALFNTPVKLAEALLSEDKSSFSPSQLNYLQSFVGEVENTLINDFKNEMSNDVVSELVLMYFQQDPSILLTNQKAYDVIKSGLESRLISILRSKQSRNKEIIYNIKSKIADLKSKNTYNTDDAFIIYLDFLESAETELIAAEKYLDLLKNGSKKVDPETIMYLQTDVIGYYDYIIQNHITTLTQKNSGLGTGQLKDIKDLYNRSVLDKMSNVKTKYNEVLDIYIDKVLDKYVDDNYTLGNKEAHKRTLHAAIRNQINKGLIQTGELFFGDATQSRSPIVRIIANILNNDERETTRVVNKRGHKLLQLYKKSGSIAKKAGISFINHAKSFCELDDKGFPTGYFVRGYIDEFGDYVGINYGLFEKNKHKFEEKLRKEFNLPSDSHGNTIWNFDIEGQEDIYNEYMDKLDDWLEDNCERPYKTIYYKLRRRILTRQAREALSTIQELIQLLLEKCTDEDGYIYTSKLNPGQRSKLAALRRELEQLSNPYSVQIDNTGKILSLELKTGEQLEIANSIIAWNQWLKGGIEKKPDWTKFNEARSKITDPAELARFDADNLCTRLSPEFYDILSNCSTATQTQAYAITQAYRSKIIGLTKDSKGYVQPDLLRLNDDAWYELKRLDEDLNAEKRYGTKGIYKFDDYATMLLVTMPDPSDPTKSIPVLKYFEMQARARMAVDPNAMNEFYDKYFYQKTDSKGNSKLQPLSIFYYVAPLDSKYIETVPVNGYTEVVGGWLHNDKFRSDITETYQPKVSKYRNTAFEEIMQDDNARAFYEEIMSIMQEAIDMLPLGTNASIYKMPQITDNSSSIMSRKLARLNIGSAIFGSLALNFTITENDDDLYREDLAVRPDRSLVETVPIRFVKTLEDPTKISCDIVKTVMQFYAMSKNFLLKSQSVPVCEALISKMAGGITHSNAANEGLLKRSKTVLEMYGYGRMLTGFGDKSLKMTIGEKIATKFFNNFRRTAQIAMLAGNVFSATKGFVSAYYQTGTEAFVGRYYDKGDRLWTTGQLLKNIPAAIMSLGEGNTKSKIQAAMQHNGLASSIEHSFGDLNKSIIRRILDHFRMGLFTVGDYTINAIIMMSTYHATRLIENPSTHLLSFMTEEECVDMFAKQGKTESDAVRYFEKHSGNHLYNMYKLDKDGSFVLKDEVKIKINGKSVTIDPHTYVTKRVENRLSATAERRSSIANGVVSEHGKTRAHQGTLTRLLTTMRNYFFSQGWDRFKSGNDFSEKYYDKGEIRELNTHDIYRGQYDLETGHCEPGVFSSIGQAFLHFIPFMHDVLFALPKMIGLAKNKPRMFKKVDMQNVQKFCLDIVGTITFLLIAGCILLPKVREYPDDWWYQFLLLVSAGCAIETMTSINPVTILDLATTMTTTYGFVKDALRVIPLFKDLLGLSDHDIKEPVRSGSYQAKPRWFRDVMKLSKFTGIPGYYESFTPVIPGLDDPNKQKFYKNAVSAQNRLANGNWYYPITEEGRADIYTALTTPLGVQGKYDWYRSNTAPATLLGKRKEDKEKSDKKKNSRRRHGSKRFNRRFR